ncbi:stage II sporulation protein SpoIID [Anaerosporomusa subterranea]|jgi:stage II sporulation protein D|uniref:Stage II sporulation protein SpoIID n=1 Tax=Anaerosporomusa subterranea TaxID=1794912 RepID=A0A154BQY2_ANASB|nr:stage II sporulation protein D [Anaerosporomusa subterranea]KYZ76346.1 stage II sporulation protein SpoIID [Anaerosporomusa subterranea]MDF2502154.1 stage sporulation protein [Anaerosporomusa subterranea]
MKYGIGAMILGVAVIVIFIPMLVVMSLRGPGDYASRGVKSKADNIKIKVYLHEEDRIVDMDLEEYVQGVVAAEMPAEFHVEALKAQAVAARTFAVKHMGAFGGSGYADKPGADITTDFRQAQGQAWISQEKMKQRWGAAGYQKYWPKINQAVDGTRSMVVVFQGQPINAVFHSTSGEKTASAKEVWGYDFPYLRSVACTWDQQSPRYLDVKAYSLDELDKRLGTDVKTAAVSTGGQVAQVLDKTESGRVDKVRIGGIIFAGQQVREKLELRSNTFSIRQGEAGLEFITTGYGHGVGLCQYGANGMAKEGKTYKDILTYYYSGVTVEKASSH